MAQESAADPVELEPNPCKQFGLGRSIVRSCAAILPRQSQREADPMTQQTFTPGDLNEKFVVAIHLEAKSGEEARLAASMAAMIGPTMAEPGVILFLPCRSPTDPESFFVFELYRDESGWAAHQQTPHFKAFIDEMLPRLARRERIPFVPFAAV
jgi:quinol monooxygenase YgiN